jgi:hypothetical protein
MMPCRAPGSLVNIDHRPKEISTSLVNGDCRGLKFGQLPSNQGCGEIEPHKRTGGDRLICDVPPYLPARVREKADGRYTVGFFLRLPAQDSGAIAMPLDLQPSYYRSVNAERCNVVAMIGRSVQSCRTQITHHTPVSETVRRIRSSRRPPLATGSRTGERRNNL